MFIRSATSIVARAAERLASTMLLACCVLPLAFAAIPAAALPGWKAIDGDSVMSPEGQEIRIANIDTPEIYGKCDSERAAARRAKAATQAALARASAISLRPYVRTEDRHGRTLAYVLVDGRDLGEILIAEGLARPWIGKRRPWCQIGER
jgi:micrococcal nuclease